ncbi:MAG TPA: nicotinate (nicotinamide) nucleotide adenylyltransferase [Bryobacteraceae bacterium]|nr:nicotinate (nicotinamide) nucleotide adenylyltransferase [Bryobacteraceae bacterium]
MRTAIFGGTFDPVHSAHLEMARRAADQFRLDRVLFIPAGNPPHKQADASFEHRYRMVQLACAADPRFIASRLEEGAAKSYSIETIERVKAGSAEAAASAGAANGGVPHTAGNGALFFIIGSDAFAEIQSWRRWQDVIRAVEFIVVARPGYEIAGPPGAHVNRLDCAELPVSSSDIRDALARGESPPELPPAIADYIRDHRLYGSVS